MGHQNASNLRKINSILLIFFTILCNSQEKNDDYFSLTKGGEKYLKPVKYVLFNPEKDENLTAKNKAVFYIKNESFVYAKEKHKIDTCNIKYLNKIVFSKPEKLLEEEFEYYKEFIKKIGFWDGKTHLPPQPITSLHRYFKIFIIKKYRDDIIKYEVDWEYSSF